MGRMKKLRRREPVGYRDVSDGTVGKPRAFSKCSSHCLSVPEPTIVFKRINQSGGLSGFRAFGESIALALEQLCLFCHQPERLWSGGVDSAEKE